MTQKPEMVSAFHSPYPAVPNSEPGVLALCAAGGTVELAIEQIESLACCVRRITFRSAAGPPGGEAAHWVQEVNRVLHTLDLLELDQATQAFLARTRAAVLTEQPTRGYFELQRTPDGVVLSRFTARPHQPRQSIPFVVTQEMLHGLMRAFEHAVAKTAA